MASPSRSNEAKDTVLIVQDPSGTNDMSPPDLTLGIARSPVESEASNDAKGDSPFNGTSGVTPPPNDLKAAAHLMDRGLAVFGMRLFSQAVDCYKRALTILTEYHGKLSPECAQASYKYALALMYEVPVPLGGDPMGIVPKECDYHQLVLNDGALTVAKQDGNLIHRDSDIGIFLNVVHGDVSKNLDCAQDELEDAWSVVEKQPGYSLDKVNILSALGELAFKKAEFNGSLLHYRAALSNLEHLVPPDSQRLAHVKFKICLCLEQQSRIDDAIESCQQALRVCTNRLERLDTEFQRSLKKIDADNRDVSSASSFDHSILEKQNEIKRLTGLSHVFQAKLFSLQQLFKALQTPSPSSSSKQELASAEAMDVGTSADTSTITHHADINSPLATTHRSEFNSPDATTRRAEFNSPLATTRRTEFNSPLATTQRAEFNSPLASTSQKMGTSHGVEIGGAKRQLPTEPASEEFIPPKRLGIDSHAWKHEGGAS